MRALTLSPVLILIFVTYAAADVQISELEDRIRVEINGQFFTEWRHEALKLEQ